MYPREVTSPIVPWARARIVETRSTEAISKLYFEEFGYDASQDFAGLDEIAIYECLETGYRFYFPHELEGKERLYRTLEQFDWCYEEGKWEHRVVAERIPQGAAVLDIGCGRGAFLARVKELNSQNVTGIELNKSAASVAEKRGICVINSLIEQHAEERPAAYDVVSAFQVLEHIAHPLPFLRSCIEALKVGGLFVIAVPNNASFLRFDRETVLNLPPHHVGLWTPASLSKLADLLPLRIECIEEEPLRELEWYQQVMERRYLPRRWQRSLYYRIGGSKLFQRFIVENSQSISGHTVIAYFRRTE